MFKKMMKKTLVFSAFLGVATQVGSASLSFADPCDTLTPQQKRNCVALGWGTLTGAMAFGSYGSSAFVPVLSGCAGVGAVGGCLPRGGTES